MNTLDDLAIELAREYAEICNGITDFTVQEQLENRQDIKEWGEAHDLSFNQAIRYVISYANSAGWLR